MLALLAAVLLAQAPRESSVRTGEADALRERAAVESDGGRLRVSLDGVLLYEGPGAKGALDVIEIAGFTGKRFVTVVADDVERARFYATSVGKPVKLLGVETSLGTDVSLRALTEGSSMTLQIQKADGRSIDVFRGPTSLGKPQISTRPESVVVQVGAAVVYMTRRGRSQPLVTVTAEEVLARFNEHRRAAGLGAVTLDAELSRACDLHALYLAKNAGREEVRGLRAHHEDPSLPGHTAEGARAGAASVISYAGLRRDLASAVDTLVATLYHRVGLLNPRLGATGVGWAFDPDGGAIVVIHTGTTTGAAPEEPVVYPGTDQRDVPREFAMGKREVPDPVPDPKLQGGYPVTVQFPWMPEEAALRVLLDGRPVDGWLSTPQNPARADFPQGRTVCFIPRMPLESQRRYTVEASAKRGAETWTKTWTFLTSK